jgi:hypothetical protein
MGQGARGPVSFLREGDMKAQGPAFQPGPMNWRFMLEDLLAQGTDASSTEKLQEFPGTNSAIASAPEELL